MPSYDRDLFEPPAPLALVTLRNRATGVRWEDVPMLLDSGADVTLIPQAATKHLGLTTAPDKRYELVGFDGSRSFAQIVELDLVFLRRTYRGQFLLIDQDWGIVGRNVLNSVTLLFDGPRLIWEELQGEYHREAKEGA